MPNWITLWRCRMCGHWSHAKRSPIAHKRWRKVLDEHGDAVGSEAIHCGPYDQWAARFDDPYPRPQYPHLGQPTGEKYDYHLHDGGPF